jgi:hypothetical protein
VGGGGAQENKVKYQENKAFCRPQLYLFFLKRSAKIRPPPPYPTNLQLKGLSGQMRSF